MTTVWYVLKELKLRKFLHSQMPGTDIVALVASSRHEHPEHLDITHHIAIALCNFLYELNKQFPKIENGVSTASLDHFLKTGVPRSTTKRGAYRRSNIHDFNAPTDIAVGFDAIPNSAVLAKLYAPVLAVLPLLQESYPEQD